MCNVCFWVYKMYFFMSVCTNTGKKRNFNGTHFNFILKQSLVGHRIKRTSVIRGLYRTPLRIACN